MHHPYMMGQQTCTTIVNRLAYTASSILPLVMKVSLVFQNKVSFIAAAMTSGQNVIIPVERAERGPFFTKTSVYGTWPLPQTDRDFEWSFWKGGSLVGENFIPATKPSSGPESPSHIPCSLLTIRSKTSFNGEYVLFMAEFGDNPVWTNKLPRIRHPRNERVMRGAGPYREVLRRPIRLQKNCEMSLYIKGNLPDSAQYKLFLFDPLRYNYLKIGPTLYSYNKGAKNEMLPVPSALPEYDVFKT